MKTNLIRKRAVVCVCVCVRKCASERENERGVAIKWVE